MRDVYVSLLANGLKQKHDKANTSINVDRHGKTGKKWTAAALRDLIAFEMHCQDITQDDLEKALAELNK